MDAVEDKYAQIIDCYLLILLGSLPSHHNRDLYVDFEVSLISSISGLFIHCFVGKRAGFLIGDGAGVGKGRTIAGIIFENYVKGRKKALWVSVSNDLKYDSERDLHDIGAYKIPVHPLNKVR